MGKDATDANVHDAILRQLLYQLSFAPIPYFVPKDKARPAAGDDQAQRQVSAFPVPE